MEPLLAYAILHPKDFLSVMGLHRRHIAQIVNLNHYIRSIDVFFLASVSSKCIIIRCLANKYSFDNLAAKS